MPNACVLRDIKTCNIAKVNEVFRRAYLYVARDETLSPQVQYQAQLRLNTFGKYTLSDDGKEPLRRIWMWSGNYPQAEIPWRAQSFLEDGSCAYIRLHGLVSLPLFNQQCMECS
ncbi:uncharacterized protein BJ212DRAFT_271321 [Suillus subaureus]|uniref:Uncharacterized protein n=1 Tax=Suillus subaureus TaxID=48587 RepID=A0A9P7DLQ2_9AGAM|nr:uncharacterized protein BJ212DRAFT_271321 [Suillus subaureus]KAG1797905.1 hypothetical protein BJ212DRAFT_271321 [Suillus subaureus]